MPQTHTHMPACDISKAYIATHGGFDAALIHARATAPAAEQTAVLERWDTHRKACDACGKSTQFGELRDITCCGDWLTVCLSCAAKFT